METSVIVPDETTVRVKRVVNWYTQGFLTEEELLHLLEQSIHPSTLDNVSRMSQESAKEI